MESLRRIRHLVVKEFIQIFRNKQNFGVLLIAPILQLIIFGFACRLDVNDVSTVVADLDRSSLSRQVIEAFSRSGYFHITALVDSYDSTDRYLETGGAAVAVLIPPDFERRLKAGNTAQVGVLIDGVDTTTAGTVSGYAQSILQGVSKDIIQTRLKLVTGLRTARDADRLVVPVVTDASRAWFNPNLVSKDFFVPGVIVLVLVGVTIMTTASVIVGEREMGTIEQLMVTPITPMELILGKTIPCYIIAVTTMMLLTPLALLIFDFPLRGSIFFFLGTALLFLLTASAIGITISAFCKTQKQAVLSSFMFLQPSVLLSGYTFPIENMPEVVQYATYLNPLRYFITIVRGVFLKGTGWDVLWPQVLPIFVIGLAYILLASFLLKKQLD
jgi:ABC-2 type transport system permease protein